MEGATLGFARARDQCGGGGGGTRAPEFDAFAGAWGGDKATELIGGGAGGDGRGTSEASVDFTKPDRKAVASEEAAGADAFTNPLIPLALPIGFELAIPAKPKPLRWSALFLRRVSFHRSNSAASSASRPLSFGC